VRAVLDDAEVTDDKFEVRDTDLALLVNALWSAGAEAVSVNGQRVSAMTSIRYSAPAIEVNSIGIAPPYTVLAIGDSGRMQADFYDTSTGLAFQDEVGRFGWRFDMDNVDQLSLPSAPIGQLRLRSVRVGVGSGERPTKPGEVPQ
jgi:uncharacterized protein YlxW (UPF0749 family)